MRRAACAVAAVATVATLGACTGADSAPGGAVVRDSAGVTIVESEPRGWSPERAWRVGEEAVVRIGVVEGDPAYQLDNVRGSVRLSDGRIVIANGGSGELRMYDPDGRHLTTMGRRGGGPGEFQGLQWIGPIAGDTIAAWDWSARRLSRFAPAGTFVSSVMPGGPDGEMFATVGGITGSGMLIGTGGWVMPPQSTDGVMRPPLIVRRYAPDGAQVDTLGPFPGAEAALHVQRDGQRMQVRRATPVFGRATFVAVHGDRIFVGDNERFQVDVYGSGGVLERSIRLHQPPVSATPDLVQRAREAALENVPPQAREGQAAMLAELEPKSTLPAFRSLVVDRAGNLWVERYRIRAADAAAWAVFDGEGRFLGDVMTPERFVVHEVGDDYVLGRWRDEIDVEYVLMYPLHKERR